MSPVDKNTIKDKLLRLREVVNILNESRESSKEEFLKDSKLSGSVMFNMVVGIELIVDIGNHILAEAFQKPAKTYKDVIIFLGEFEVIPKEFSENNKEMPDFRNKLIHDYDRVSLDKVYEYLQKAPSVFTEFAQYYAEFIK